MKTTCETIPKKLHAVWLGDVLRQEGKENIENWIRINPDYEMNLWVDSSTFVRKNPAEAQTIQKNWAKLKAWAKEHNVIIHDVNPHSEDHEVNRNGLIYEQMKAKHYYRDELRRPGNNEAAASDILRVEILRQEGGVYVDAEDMKPKDPLGTLVAEHGLLFHCYWNGNLNNDIMASVPDNPLLEQLANDIFNNYQTLYQKDKRFLLAHRHHLLQSFRTTALKVDRLCSTVKISGPDALGNCVAKKHPLLQLGFRLPNPFHFDPTKFVDSEKTAVSWINKEPTLSDLNVYFRFQVIEYLNFLIESLPAEDSRLQTLGQKLSGFINDRKLLALLEDPSPLFNEKEIAYLNQNGKDIFNQVRNYFQEAENFLLYCKHSTVKLMSLFDFFVVKSQYDNPNNLAEGLNYTQSMVYFFHKHFLKGFYEIIQLRERYAAMFKAPEWDYSFSPEEQSALDSLVADDKPQSEPLDQVAAISDSVLDKTRFVNTQLYSDHIVFKPVKFEELDEVLLSEGENPEEEELILKYYPIEKSDFDEVLLRYFQFFDSIGPLASAFIPVFGWAYLVTRALNEGEPLTKEIQSDDDEPRLWYNNSR